MKCKFCKQPAEMLMQYMDTGEDWSKPTFTFPGYHYRGFKTYPICNTCKDIILAMNSIELKDVADSLTPGLEP